jgi:hypothetical protein
MAAGWCEVLSFFFHSKRVVSYLPLFELADVFMRFDHIPGLISGAFGPREMLGKRSPTISVKPDKVGAASRR